MTEQQLTENYEMLMAEGDFYKSYQLMRKWIFNYPTDSFYYKLGKVAYIVKGGAASLYWLSFSNLPEAREYEKFVTSKTGLKPIN
jgi:hypothetical protein